MKGVVIATPGGMYFSGGMATVTRSMVEWWRKNGVGTKVFVLDPRGRGPRWMFPLFLLLSIQQLVWLRAARGVDVLHLQVSEQASFLRKGILLATGHALGMQVVLHHHGAELIPFFESSRGFMRRWVSWTIRHADLNIILGNKWRAFLVDRVGAAPERVEVLYNASPCAGGAAQRAGEPKPEAAFTFLLLASLSPRKGVSEFLQAVAELHVQQGLKVSAKLAGDGQIERYRKEADDLGIGAVCTFTGWLDKSGVASVLSEADALVVPSYEEGLPMVILEALSVSLPVVATTVGSIPEVFQDGEQMLLVAPGEVGPLAIAMQQVATDEGLRRRLADNGLAAFKDRFGMDGYMHKVSALYQRLTAASGAQVPPQGPV